MRVLLVVAVLVVMAGAASVSLEDLEFHGWKEKFDKSYSSEEEESQRKMIWLESRKLVLQHNLLADQGIKSYRLGLNHFADMDNQEYQARFSGCLGSFNMTKTRSATAGPRQAMEADLPDEVDWRREGYVTDVKNQQPYCGSCWAFSAVNRALEGQMFRRTGKLVPLSEQQLVDCSQQYRNQGCCGGFPHRAFEYVIDSKGLEGEYTYPYQAKNGECRYNVRNAKATCRGYRMIKPGNENYLQSVVATVGPISVGVNITSRTFQLYESGVYDEPACGDTTPNHAVLVVGYGTNRNRQDYWLVKNSWGPMWGDKGYFKIARNQNNQCGIATYITYPEV